MVTPAYGTSRSSSTVARSTVRVTSSSRLRSSYDLRWTTSAMCLSVQQIGQCGSEVMQTRLQRIRPVHSPVDDSTGQRADDDVGERLRVVFRAHLAAGDALLDEFVERVVQCESPLHAV